MANAQTKNAPRKLELPKRRFWNPKTWHRSIPLPPRRPLSSTGRLIKETIKLVSRDWRTFWGITFVYALAVFVFVRSFDISASLEAIPEEATASNGLVQAFTDLSLVVGSMGSSLSAASSVYQVLISIICALALIYFFRKVLSDEKTSLKDSFYNGMGPLVQYLLVLFVLGAQLIPLAIFGYLMSVVQSSVLLFKDEQAIFMAAYIIFALLTIRALTHTIFALYAVTLPDITPMKALRGAKKMVYKRRFAIWRKIISAIIFVVMLTVIIMLPLLLWLPGLVPWVFYAITILIFAFGQAYLYNIYREIL